MKATIDTAPSTLSSKIILTYENVISYKIVSNVIRFYLENGTTKEWPYKTGLNIKIDGALVYENNLYFNSKPVKTAVVEKSFKDGNSWSTTYHDYLGYEKVDDEIIIKYKSLCDSIHQSEELSTWVTRLKIIDEFGNETFEYPNHSSNEEDELPF